MRLYEKLRAQILTDYTYTWAATNYNNILVRDDLPTAARNTASTEITSIGTSPTYSTTTVRWILTRKYANTTVLDGYARGNVQVRINDYNVTTKTTDLYAVVSLTTINSAGTETTLATVTTGTWSKTTHTDETIDLPFWLEVETQTLASTERLLLKVVFYVRSDSLTDYIDVYYLTAFNIDDIFVEIPIVPGADM